MSKMPHVVSTVLGSCISVCLWDTVLNFGGMNHYIHAKPFNKSKRTAQFGSVSIPYLVRLLLEQGSQMQNLKAHIVGGASNPQMKCSKIGQENIDIAEKLLKKFYIDVITMDTGGEMGRKVVFDTKTGEIIVYKVNNLRKSDWYGN